MDFAAVNWSYVGFTVMGVCALVFVAFALKRQWTIAALLVALLQMPIALVNSAAPFRGALDPTYPGYIQGLVHADKGIEVALFAGAMLLGGLACACIALLNRAGPRNYFIVGFDALLLLTLAPASLSGVAERGLQGSRVEFGHYLQFGGLAAFLFEFGLLLAPPAIGLLWAWRRACGQEGE